MTLTSHLVDLILIVGAVGGEGSDGIGDLVEQSVSHRGIVDILARHCDSDDLAVVGVDADMQFVPGPAAGCAVLFDQPNAGTAELQASAVHQQMQRPVPSRRSGGIPSAVARRLSVEWSGTARSTPSSPMTEPIRPSV
jgi:hypothetical protein